MSNILIGPNCKLVFENNIKNKLVHSGDNLVCQMIMDYYDSDVKKIKVEQLHKIEKTVFLRIFGHEKVYAKVFEDIGPTNETDTNSIFMLNFILKQGQIVDFKDSKNKITLGIAHDLYPYEINLTEQVREELVKNFS